MHNTPLHGIRRILVMRLGSIGDILLTTPVLRLLHQNWPEAAIEFLVKDRYQDLLREHPCLDRLWLFEHRQTLHHTLYKLRQRHYDLVLDLHRTLRSRLLYRGLSARYKLAYNKRPLRRALLVHLGWNRLQDLTPVPELYAAPLRRLGLREPLPALEMHLEPGLQEVMQTHLTRAFPDGYERPLLALAPGARWPTKRWPVARFAAVAQALASSQGAAVIILGGQEDVLLAAELCRQLRVPVLDCTGKMTLMQTAALLQQCRLLLSNDSGLMHMATALKVPVVAIFGPTVEAFGFYPFQAQAQVVSAAVSCRPCSTKGSPSCPRGHHHCMQHVTGAQVLAAVQSLWQNQGIRHDQAAL